MVDNDSEIPKREPVTSWGDLVRPDRPANIPYAEGEDYDAQAMLQHNGYDLEPSTLMPLLDPDFEVTLLQSAAARVLGAQGNREAIDALKTLANDDFAMEDARIQAAYALARMGEDTGKPALINLLSPGFGGSATAVMAAGALAQLGDTRGFDIVTESLNSDNMIDVMIACKQLYYFATADPDNAEVYAAFRKALSHEGQGVVSTAKHQLAQLDTPQARDLLAEFS